MREELKAARFNEQIANQSKKNWLQIAVDIKTICCIDSSFQNP